jgi:hypothetical protein
LKVPGPLSEPTLPAGTIFGRYEIVRVRGRGGMGTVYEALHTSLRKKVAIKVLNPELVWNEEARHRFVREGELAARIQHDNVVDVHDVGALDELPYLVMEYLEGEDLGALLSREGRLSVARTIDIVLPIIAGLGAGHALGIVHRDLKPQNIFLSRRADGEIVPKALDFGVSKLLEEQDHGTRLTRTGMVCGTVHYMSPEQARGVIPITAASDQYALGDILYECLTGHQPYPGDRVLQILSRVGRGDFVPPRQVAPDLDPELEAVVLRAMAYEPADRFPSLTALGRALLPFGSERARLLWAESFTATDSGRTAALSLAAAQALEAAAADAAKVTRTRVQPAASAPAGSPAPRFASTVSVFRWRKSQWALVPLGLACVVGLAAALWTRDRGAPPRPAPIVETPRPPAPAAALERAPTPPAEPATEPATEPAPQSQPASAAAPAVPKSAARRPPRAPAKKTATDVLRTFNRAPLVR